MVALLACCPYGGLGDQPRQERDDGLALMLVEGLPHGRLGRGPGSSRFRLNCTIRLLLHSPRSAPQGVDERASEQQIGKSETQEI